MRENDEETMKNFEEFFEHYGLEEFVTVYLQRILLEMYKVGVYSTGNTLATELVHQYFFTEKGDVRPLEEINSFDAEIEKRCFDIAQEIVTSLGVSFFSEIPSSSDDFDTEVVNKLNRMLQRALSKHLGVRWGK